MTDRSLSISESLDLMMILLVAKGVFTLWLALLCELLVIWSFKEFFYGVIIGIITTLWVNGASYSLEGYKSRHRGKLVCERSLSIKFFVVSSASSNLGKGRVFARVV